MGVRLLFWGKNYDVLLCRERSAALFYHRRRSGRWNVGLMAPGIFRGLRTVRDDAVANPAHGRTRGSRKKTDKDDVIPVVINSGLSPKKFLIHTFEAASVRFSLTSAAYSIFTPILTKEIFRHVVGITQHIVSPDGVY